MEPTALYLPPAHTSVALCSTAQICARSGAPVTTGYTTSTAATSPVLPLDRWRDLMCTSGERPLSLAERGSPSYVRSASQVVRRTARRRRPAGPPTPQDRAPASPFRLVFPRRHN